MRVLKAPKGNAALSELKVQWDQKVRRDRKENLVPRVMSEIPGPRVLRDLKGSWDLRECLEILDLLELKEFPVSKVRRAHKD
jgi:hypothetical protein